MKEAPWRFKDTATMAIEDPVTMEGAMERSDKDQWRKKIKEKLKSVDDIEARTKLYCFPESPRYHARWCYSPCLMIRNMPVLFRTTPGKGILPKRRRRTL